MEGRAVTPHWSLSFYRFLIVCHSVPDRAVLLKLGILTNFDVLLLVRPFHWVWFNLLETPKWQIHRWGLKSSHFHLDTEFICGLWAQVCAIPECTHQRTQQFYNIKGRGFQSSLFRLSKLDPLTAPAVLPLTRITPQWENNGDSAVNSGKFHFPKI